MLISSSIHGTSSIDTDLEAHGQKCNERNYIPDPAPPVGRKRGGQAGNEHDQVGGNGNEEVSTVQAANQGHVDQNERRGDDPVDVADPEDLTEVFLAGVVRLVHNRVFVRDALASGHGKIREERDSGNQSCQGMEQTGLLSCVSHSLVRL